MGKALRAALALASFAILATGSAAFAASPNPAPYGVTASFTYAPAAPMSGEVVALASTATATGDNNQVALQLWDLDGDGAFDDAVGANTARTFPAAGSYTVSLKAYDRHGHSAVATQSIAVAAPPPPPPPVLAPFPVVRMAGKVTRRGTRLRRLSVEAPSGSTITLRCHGRRGCPLRQHVEAAASQFDSRGLGGRVIRFHRFERRLLPAGIVIKVFVTKPGMIGKFARFKIRRRKPPARTDGCVVPGVATPTRCPSS
jgi:hypothetical protein